MKKRKQKFRSLECHAKYLLEDFFSEEFRKLCLCDKPDLQSSDGKKGIEVVSAVGEKEKEAEALFRLLNTDSIDKRLDEEEIKDRIEKSGGLLGEKDNKSSLVTVDADSFRRTIEKLERKLELLNKDGDAGYKYFPENSLFVETEIMADESMKEEALKEMIGLSAQYNRSFDQVFVFSNHEIWIFDLKSARYKTRELDKQILRKISERVRSINSPKPIE